MISEEADKNWLSFLASDFATSPTIDPPFYCWTNGNAATPVLRDNCYVQGSWTAPAKGVVDESNASLLIQRVWGQAIYYEAKN